MSVNNWFSIQKMYKDRKKKKKESLTSRVKELKNKEIVIKKKESWLKRIFKKILRK